MKVICPIIHPALPTLDYDTSHFPVLSITFAFSSQSFYNFHDGVGPSMEKYDSWIVGCHID